jgi:hypothetical protein
VAQLIKETEDIIGKEKERCTLPKDVDLADLGQTRESFQNDFSHLSEQIDMLAFENCLLKDQIQVQSDMINAIKISQDAAIMYVQEKKSLENKFNHELAEKDKKIRFLQNTTENLVRLMEKMKQEREETNKVVLLGISSCTSRDIDNQMDNMSVMEGTQK